MEFSKGIEEMAFSEKEKQVLSFMKMLANFDFVFSVQPFE